MQNSVNIVLGRLNWRLEGKNVVQGGEGSNLFDGIIDAEAKIISGFDS
jgi:hypothetical protein